MEDRNCLTCDHRGDLNGNQIDDHAIFFNADDEDYRYNCPWREAFRWDDIDQALECEHYRY